MTNETGRKRRIRWALAGAFLAAISILAAGAAPAQARTFFSFRVGVPLYAGPPAYYYGPYYAPAPVYYTPPPVVVVPTPAASPCRSGLWRRQDGAVVNGIACLQPNGLWRLTN